LRQQELEQLIATARQKFMPYVQFGDLSEVDVEEAVALLKRDEATLNPRNRRYRNDIIRCLKGETAFFPEPALIRFSLPMAACIVSRNSNRTSSLQP
jgi:hypothetical protein